ncbi:MAG TPA: sigma-70 family RNA polymerase sigma factor [Acidimicrobiales bacterium]|nr:sigma-70 family RNA polymerase sigma factor [Acidimicrobiales bacterium]
MDQTPSVGRDTESVVAAAWRDQKAFSTDLAFRMLGDIAEAEDVVQEAFARLLQANPSEIGDVRGWLVVVVSRLCLDILRSARLRRGVSVPDNDLDQRPGPANPLADPADRITLDDSVRSALLVVLEKLSPAEQTAFVLHDVFGYEFETVGSVVGRSSQACRQLAARARHRVHAEAGPARFAVEPSEHRELAERFISACAGGDLAAVMKLLDPDVVGGIDSDERGRPVVRRGSRSVARNILRYVGIGSDMTLVSNPRPGPIGLLAFRESQLIVAFDLEVRNGLISHIEGVRRPERLDAIRSRLGLRVGD